MIQIILVTILVALLIIHGCKYFVEKVLRVPPGPWGLPIVGYYPFLGPNPVTKMFKLGRVYGDIMTVNYFGRYYYYLNSFDVIKEVLVLHGNDTIDRPEQFSLNSPFGVCLTKKSFVTSSGDHWKLMHGFILSSFTKLGMGKDPFEMKINLAKDKLIGYVLSKNGQPFDCFEFLNNFASNVVNMIISSEMYDYNDPVYVRLRDYTRKFFITIEGIDGNLSGILFHLFKPYEELRELGNEFRRFIIPQFEGMLKERQAKKQEFNDLLDYFSEKNLLKAEHFEVDSIAENCFTLFAAGTEVVSTTLYHAINLLILHPEVQKKLREEIDGVIASGHKISYQQRHLLPYTQAVIQEVQRYACVIPVGISRRTLKPITVTTKNERYTIPKNAITFSHIFTALRDGKRFRNPDNFDPNNFINELGEFAMNNGNIPFSAGRRMCIGNRIAKMELFIAFVDLFHKFEWKSPNDQKVPRVIHEAQARIVAGFECRAIPRTSVKK